MFEQEHHKKSTLSAYLVGIRRHGLRPGEAEEHLAELRELVNTMGADLAGEIMVNLQRPQAAHLVGEGKAEEITREAKAVEADVVIIDDDLSPAQQRNWEKLSGLAVIDRREVILDIFGQRAHTREARLQVELARLEYSLPRLTRAWTHLERQRGGRGFTGGAGEAQIEVDRRIVRDSIARCKKELQAVRRQRATQRKGRQGRPVPNAALVGYTNSGKSSLLNLLTSAGVLAEDKLFATLDPTTRRIDLPNNQPLLLTDTVGFIRKLPHMLVEAFYATLEEAQLADVLLHVVDVSHPCAEEHIKATREVLHQLELDDKPILYLFNKCDLLDCDSPPPELRAMAPEFLLTSARTGQGREELMSWLEKLTCDDMEFLTVRLPSSRHDLVSFLYREGNVTSCTWDDDIAVIDGSLPRKFLPSLEPFRVLPQGSTPGTGDPSP